MYRLRNLRLSMALILLLGSASPTPAWCNRPEQPDSEATDNFDLPEVLPEAKPFTFDEPDESRLVRKLEYKLDPAGKSVFLVAISNRLTPQQAEEVQAGILGIISSNMCLPADALVVWGADLRRVATFRNDARVQDCSPKWLKFKVAQNKAEFARLNQYLEEMKNADHQGRATLNVPHVVHHLGQEFHEYHDYPNRILVLFGSAIDIGGTEGAAMETAYPTVGMLRAELSPLSTRGKAWYLGNTVTHFVHTDTITSRVHRDGLQNFWAAFFTSLGSPLLTFSPDPRVSERVLNPALPVLPAYVDDVNPGFVAVSEVRLFDDFAGSTIPTRLERGSLRIALKWIDPEIDLDLHVGLVSGGERLSFRNPRTEFGTLRKDFGTGWEEVSLTQEVSPREIDLWVNFFRGMAPAQGVKAELRVAFAGTLYRWPVTLAAQTGNEGRVDSPEHWRRIDIQQVLSGLN